MSMDKQDKLSIVVPCHNEEENLPVFHKTLLEIQNTMSTVHFEYVFVDDGSQDNTWMQIALLAKNSPNVVGIKLSRNFGKESAILAGLSNVSGGAVVVIDCDMQHPPELIPEMYRIWQEDAVDVVEGIKQSRGNESKLYRAFANFFYALVEKTGSINLRGSSDFQLMDRKVADVISSLPERQRFFRALSSWSGFKRAKVQFRVQERLGGISKWSFFKLFKYAINNITSFSTIPLQIVTLLGFVFFVAATILGIHTLYVFIAGVAVEGFTTVILLLLIIGSMLMISLGILGIYVAKIYEEIKGRPPYLIELIIAHDKDKDIAG